MPDGITIDPRLLEQMKRIELRSRFLVQGLYNSRHRTTKLGTSTEFVDYREYQPGDEISTIDWRVYARTDRLFVKRFEMEANMHVRLFLDTSESMRVPPPPGLLSKLDLAATIAGAIATMVIVQQDSAGLICIGDRIMENLPPRQGRRHLSMLFRHLGAPRGNGGGDFGELARRPMQEIGRRRMVFVLTDALDEPTALLDVLKGFTVREQDVTLFQVLDQNEIEFPFDTMTEFRHPETGQRTVGNPIHMRADYLHRLNSHLGRIETACKQFGVDYVRLHNGEDVANILASHFLRRLMTGGARCSTR